LCEERKRKNQSGVYADESTHSGLFKGGNRRRPLFSGQEQPGTGGPKRTLAALLARCEPLSEIQQNIAIVITNSM